MTAAVSAAPGQAAHRAILALILMSAIWGYNWVVMKQVLQYVAPFDFAALRTLFGALALFGLLAVTRRSMKLVALRQTLVLGMLQTAVFTGLIQWAVVAGGAGKTAVLVYTMPFWLLPLAWWWLGERVRGLQWLAVAFAAAGLVMVFEPWSSRGGTLSSVLAVAAGATWAMSAVVVKRLRRDVAVDLLALTAWQMLFGALALCLVALVVPSRPIEPTAYFFGALAFNALFATGLAWLLWLYVLQHLSAGMSGLSALGVPLIGVLSGWLELGERPSGAEASGMVLIGIALLVVSSWALWRARRAQAASSR